MTGVPEAAVVLPGAALALLVWAGMKLFEEMPVEDRRFRDPPPWGFRVVWPLIRVVVHCCGSFLGVDRRMRILQRLKMAGVDYGLSPEQFFGGKVVAALGAVGVFGAVSGLLAWPWDLSRWAGLAGAAAGGFFYPDLWLRETVIQRRREVIRRLPFFLDMVTLAVESGSNLTGALTLAARRAPASALTAEVDRMLRDIRAGMSRADALRAMAERLDAPPIHVFVSSVVQAERSGASLAVLLRTQADQRRRERFLAAEKRAMEAPVKLLGPLILCIFPNTFVIIVFVLMVKSMQAGVITWPPLVWALQWPG